MQGFPLLSFLTWLPIAGGIVVLMFGDRGIQAGRIVALVTAVVALLASIPLYSGFDASTFDYQFVERLPWIPALVTTRSPVLSAAMSRCCSFCRFVWGRIIT